MFNWYKPPHDTKLGFAIRLINPTSHSHDSTRTDPDLLTNGQLHIESQKRRNNLNASSLIWFNRIIQRMIIVASWYTIPVYEGDQKN